MIYKKTLLLALFAFVVLSCQTNRGNQDLALGFLPTDASTYVLVNAFLDRQLFRSSLFEAGLDQALVPRVDQVLITKKQGENLIFILGDLPKDLVAFGLKSAGYRETVADSTLPIWHSEGQKLKLAMLGDNLLVASESLSSLVDAVNTKQAGTSAPAHNVFLNLVGAETLFALSTDLGPETPFSSVKLVLSRVSKSYVLRLDFGIRSPSDSKPQALRALVRFAAISVFGAFAGETDNYELGEITSTDSSIGASARFERPSFSLTKLNDLVQGLKL